MSFQKALYWLSSPFHAAHTLCKCIFYKNIEAEILEKVYEYLTAIFQE